MIASKAGAISLAARTSKVEISKPSVRAVAANFAPLQHMAPGLTHIADDSPDGGDPGRLTQQLDLLAGNLGRLARQASDVPPGRAQARDEAGSRPGRTSP